MKHLFEYSVFEEESGCTAPEKEELEKLPEFQRIVRLVRDLASAYPGSRYDLKGRNPNGYKPGSPDEYIWSVTKSYKQGIREIYFPIGYYYFRISPCKGTIYYGQELVNKKYDLNFNSLKDWDAAFGEIGIYSIARYLNVRRSVVDKMIIEPGRIITFFAKLEHEVNEKRKYDLMRNYLLEVARMKGNDVYADLAKMVKKDISVIDKLPDGFDKKEIVKLAGYPESTARSVIKFGEIFGF